MTRTRPSPVSALFCDPAVAVESAHGPAEPAGQNRLDLVRVVYHGR
jgi:hypothetical protein